MMLGLVAIVPVERLYIYSSLNEEVVHSSCKLREFGKDESITYVRY